MAFIAGVRDSYSDADERLIDLKDGLAYLKPRNDGIGLLKRIGMSGFVAKSVKHEWNEVSLAARREAVAAGGILIGDADVTVADAYIYQVNNLIRIEAEILRVTAIKDATTITCARGEAGTAAAGHAATKPIVLLGVAEAENAAAPAGRSDNHERLYNYVQTFTTGVEMSNDEVMALNVEGNPLTGQLKRRTIEWYQRFAQAFFYGVRYDDTTNKRRFMGGLKQFITTNPTSAGGALSLALIDAEIKQIVDAGGDPKVMVMGTKQKQKLDALDASLVRLGKKEHIGGNPDVQTWQSGIMDHSVEIIVDPTILDDELWILDTDYIKIGYFAGNGQSGALGVHDATTPGTDGVKKVLRGKYTVEVLNEKAHSFLYALT
jgi:hypothetical protein